MERLNRKYFSLRLAAITFLSVIVIDVVLEAIAILYFDQQSRLEMIVAVPFWIINFLGLPFLLWSGGTLLLELLACLLSAFFWATVAGYFIQKNGNA
jgi:hypothetical protein